jgi:D-beta-D-heptose 7-phosphate kinase/D-beta-D-heptose 1-phosphate adenosyltransferase
MHDLIDKLHQMGSPRIGLVGDFMLDRYVYGDVERISPEAPVPVLRSVRTETRPGGAGNVSAAVAALGGMTTCFGSIGNDADGKLLAELLQAVDADTTGLRPQADRPTTVKCRFVGLAQHRHAQQMFRVDDEEALPLPTAAHDAMIQAMADCVEQLDALALEDYDKGTITDETGPAWIAAARQAGKPVLVDPALINNYSRYRGATLLTPNRYETELASGITITDDASLDRAAQAIIDVTDAQAVVVTLDKEGAYLRLADGTGKRIPTRPRSVYDVTGAGDVVLAMLAVAVAEGCDFDDAVALSNVAGGLEVERFGVAPIRRQEVIDELNHMLGLRSHKVLDRAQLAEELAVRRQQSETIIFTNGCFDLTHMGHVRYLQQARELGNLLVVAINSDASVRRLKGERRPIIGQEERAEMLAALECVDYVTIFDEDTPIPLLECLKPDVLVKGGSTPVVVGQEQVEAYGGRVLTLDLVEGLSTTSIIDRILNTHSDPADGSGGDRS